MAKVIAEIFDERRTPAIEASDGALP